MPTNCQATPKYGPYVAGGRLNSRTGYRCQDCGTMYYRRYTCADCDRLLCHPCFKQHAAVK